MATILIFIATILLIVGFYRFTHAYQGHYVHIQQKLIVYELAISWICYITSMGMLMWASIFSHLWSSTLTNVIVSLLVVVSLIDPTQLTKKELGTVFPLPNSYHFMLVVLGGFFLVLLWSMP